MKRNIKFGCPVIGGEEKAAVLSVLNGDILVHGPVAKKFEEAFAEFVNARRAVSVSSATAGLHLIYFALGVGPGDEVIVPAQTHVATAHAVELVGATPIFVDCEPKTGNIDPKLLGLAITAKTKAISLVHYLGVPVDMDPIVKIATQQNLFIVEDCALSHGASYNGVHTGLIGDAGVFSFYPVKHMTTAEGGVVILKDNLLADKLTKLKAFGVNRNHAERTVAGGYDVDELGFNYRMSEVHAAIGVEQLKKLPNFLEARRANHQRLSTGLADLNAGYVLEQPFGDKMKSSHYCLGFLLNKKMWHLRPKIIKELDYEGVGSSVYYPGPVPFLKYYREKYGLSKKSFPNACALSEGMIALPVGPHLVGDDMDYIAEVMINVLRKNNA